MGKILLHTKQKEKAGCYNHRDCHHLEFVRIILVQSEATGGYNGFIYYNL